MVNDIITKLNNLAPMGDQLDELAALLNIDDNRFASIYEEVKPKIKEIFSSKSFYEEMIDTLKTTPMGDIEEEKKSVEEFIEEIKADDSLSNEKKDFLVTLIEEAVLVTFELYEVPRERITVKIERINDNAVIPTYAHNTDAGADICAAENITIMQGETKIVKTGLKVAIPVGYEIQVRPRSGLSAKSGLRIANAPGTIKVA